MATASLGIVVSGPQLWPSMFSVVVSWTTSKFPAKASPGALQLSIIFASFLLHECHRIRNCLCN
ncbi:hypothetical protein NC653_035222 [Populus alba x Populus x berolinensis]|uniref:Uncharacterized protein n=1 Tax=Populus alba x Populus x berolinensis TaxID=444605 RepID=A0AAD6LPE1_9ROSI|nr:hypothetical protein NC653_035222 [Populus alba x Populus x berolinensis]